LFGAASDSSGAAVLRRFKWYGSDSVALSKGLIEDRKAAAFAVIIGYPNPILGLRDADESLWKPVSDSLTRKLGRTPDSFALAAYDGFIVGYTSLKNADANASASALGQQLVTVASTHHGLTGQTNLNAAGDRASGNYDFWSVCPSGSTYTWVRTATYTAATGGSAARAEHVRPC
jgi:ABC-type branched-subunit amino acid transport system substrate-binding protein